MTTVTYQDIPVNQNIIFNNASNGEIFLITRPKNKNIVILSEEEFIKREKALKNIEYLAMLDESFLQAKNGETYEFTNGKFNTTSETVKL